VAFHRHTLLLLDDCLYALQATIPQLTRSALHCCLQRHSVSRLPEVDKKPKAKFKAGPVEIPKRALTASPSRRRS
jgi:hypothetical protein